jgi:hypothetical protein
VRLFKPDELAQFREEVYGEQPLGPRPGGTGDSAGDKKAIPEANGKHPEEPNGS